MCTDPFSYGCSPYSVTAPLYPEVRDTYTQLGESFLQPKGRSAEYRFGLMSKEDLVESRLNVSVARGGQRPFCEESWACLIWLCILALRSGHFT